MRIAGFGMNSRATADSLAAALAAAGPADALAALDAHAARMESLARTLGLPLIAVASVAGIATPTQSPRSLAAHRTGSVAEAVALAAAGPGAWIVTPRTTAPDGRATCAIAAGADASGTPAPEEQPARPLLAGEEPEGAGLHPQGRAP